MPHHAKHAQAAGGVDVKRLSQDLHAAVDGRIRAVFQKELPAAVADAVEICTNPNDESAIEGVCGNIQY